MNSYKLLREKANHVWQQLVEGEEPVIYIGAATCGRSAGALAAKKRFEEKLEDVGLTAKIVEVGCFGPCYASHLFALQKLGKQSSFLET